MSARTDPEFRIVRAATGCAVNEFAFTSDWIAQCTGEPGPAVTCALKRLAGRGLLTVERRGEVLWYRRSSQVPPDNDWKRWPRY